ncbi:MAG: MarR family winged helix-turn-helix transcriptional regulator [Planctomycetota bacterium]
MSHAPDSLLDAIETFLADGLRRDAAATRHPESTARVLLALGPDEAVPMGEVARRIARDPSTVTRFVLKATHEGLLEQKPGVEDRRERLLLLTPAGRAARDDLLRRRRAAAALVVRGVQARTALGAEEVDWFLGALHAALVDPVAPPTPTA